MNTLSLGSLSSPTDSRHTNCWRNSPGSRERREIKADTLKSGVSLRVLLKGHGKQAEIRQKLFLGKIWGVKEAEIGFARI